MDADELVDAIDDLEDDDDGESRRGRPSAFPLVTGSAELKAALQLKANGLPVFPPPELKEGTSRTGPKLVNSSPSTTQQGDIRC